ncbi:MAG TPA: cupin domain-containing protein [Rhodothermales bacterium]
MRITRIYATPDGESHFEDMEIAVEDAGPIGSLSEPVQAHAVTFRENDADYDFDWHQAPQRQFVVLLDGHIEIEVSDGERRQFRGGDVLLVEDVIGRGHRSRTVDGKPRRSLFIALPEAPVTDVVQQASEESFPGSDAPAWTGAIVT